MPLLTGALRLFAILNPSLKDMATPLSRNRKASDAKAKKLLNRQPRNHEEAILVVHTSIFSYEDLRFTGFVISNYNVWLYNKTRAAIGNGGK